MRFRNNSSSRRSAAVVLDAILIVTFVSSTADAGETILFVDADATGPSHDGSSWLQPQA